ncbi:MAG: Transcriptional regulator LacI family [Lachnoclostridium sp.]|jgi:transcriptional regulator with XRE-family HTH domain
MKNKVTVKDVAKAAGVSVATVSYIMNNKTDQKISDETRKKVLQWANLLNYTPSSAAKSLATGKNNIIGISYQLNPMTPSRNLDFINFVNLLVERLNRLKYDVLIMPIKDTEDKIPYNRNVDGIITFDLPHEEFKELADAYYVPIIAVDMIVNDFLFYQIYSDIPTAIKKSAEFVGKDYYFILEKYENKNYTDFIIASVPKDRVIFYSDVTVSEIKKLNNKKVIVLGSYLALMVLPYLDAENTAVINLSGSKAILPDDVHVVNIDISKKANLVINILLNAMDRKFDVTHDHKVF